MVSVVHGKAMVPIRLAITGCPASSARADGVEGAFRRGIEFSDLLYRKSVVATLSFISIVFIMRYLNIININ